MKQLSGQNVCVWVCICLYLYLYAETNARE